ncbi:hypothetical protein ANCCAN_15763 [Ancylostoma caninum]|uniref:Uncharacterized protein n=1 Tax=Ancylostoma caninum TaxID=29170 RepID=A0A368G1J5_ANCCA|nr:hypothetical protein ANCCAN_15763 [Ancylostoma caninum]
MTHGPSAEKSKTPEEKSTSKNEIRKPGPPPVRKRISKVTNMFGIKKLAFQFNRAVGNVDSTALPQQVRARCQDCDGYRAAIAETCDAMMQIMQGSPDHRPAVNSAQQLEYPPGTAPSEIFEKSLEKVKGYWYDEVVSSITQKRNIIGETIKGLWLNVPKPASSLRRSNVNYKIEDDDKFT